VTHVLVVDDEPHLLRALVLNLANHGYRVSSATTGTAALAQAATAPPDVMVLDLGLPDIDGLEVIARIRKRRPQLPIIVLSARSGSQDKIDALDLGAVDYVTKPFDVNELIARLGAASRRASMSQSSDPIALGPTTVDFAARLVTRERGTSQDRDRETIHLTPTEWRMLEVLLRNPGTLITGPELLTVMRGDPEHTERSYLRIYMQQLRRKLESDPSRPRYLLTEAGMGYRYQP
jgi:two-component system KDP operon response regulator KdpE